MNKINLTEQPTKFKAEEFLVGDMVVINELEHNEIFEVLGFYYSTPKRLFVKSACGTQLTLPVQFFRSTSIAELDAKRRLTAEELARAEVS
ncbi:hypothetical protein BRY75_09690 [Acinetobacter baumannii]|uniref:hypothetical protein n=1 Tax=Acinetobacter baumannii TaxID=470 RepID=UPI00092B4749|nr:hypothetical protein [Acinetobacter baumannii]OJK07001.1 hypothetical protein BRY75_09690 [Acinetobacter baumannii]